MTAKEKGRSRSIRVSDPEQQQIEASQKDPTMVSALSMLSIDSIKKINS